MEPATSLREIEGRSLFNSLTTESSDILVYQR